VALPSFLAETLHQRNRIFKLLTPPPNTPSSGQTSRSFTLRIPCASNRILAVSETVDFFFWKDQCVCGRRNYVSCTTTLFDQRYIQYHTQCITSLTVALCILEQPSVRSTGQPTSVFKKRESFCQIDSLNI